MPDQTMTSEPPAWLHDSIERTTVAALDAACTPSCGAAAEQIEEGIEAFVNDMTEHARDYPPHQALMVLWGTLVSLTEEYAPVPPGLTAGLNVADGDGNRVNPDDPHLPDEVRGHIAALRYLVALRNDDEDTAAAVFFAVAPAADDDHRWQYATHKLMAMTGDLVMTGLINCPDSQVPAHTIARWEQKQAHIRDHHAPPPALAVQLAAAGIDRVWWSR